MVGGHNLPYDDQVPSFQHIENNNNFRRVSKIIIHENYVSAHNYDFAILKLKVGLIFSAKVGPVCLSEFPSNKHAGRVGVVSGWGTTDYNASVVSLVLKDMKVNVLSNQNCMEKAEEFREEIRQEFNPRGENLTMVNETHRHITIDRYDNMNQVDRDSQVKHLHV